MSLTNLEIAAPEYTSDAVCEKAPNLKNSFANTVITPTEIKQTASYSANFNRAVSANLDRAPEPTANIDKEPSRSINTGAEPLTEQIKRIGCDIQMAQTPQGGSIASDLFGMGCNALSAKVEPVQELVIPTQAPAPQPEAPQMRYANELSAPKMGIMA